MPAKRDVIYPGTTVRVYGRWLNTEREPTNPTSASFRHTNPSGTPTTYSSPTFVEVGKYYQDIELLTPGSHNVRAIGTGAAAATDETIIVVSPFSA